MNGKLLRILSKLQGKKVLVVGDIMLDEHIWSKVNRISPEAPVPVADVVSTVYTPGGAGNVANNIQTLGGKAYLVGVVGKDTAKDKLFEALRERGIGTDKIIVDEHRPTTLKSRIIAHGQHVVRVDREERSPIGSELSQTVLESAKSIIDEVDVLLISDYAKGVVTCKVARNLIAMAKEQGKMVSIDPKGTDYQKYKEATIVTPNRGELEIVTKMVIADEPSLVRAGQKLLQELKAEFVLVTKGKEGMSLFERKGKITHISTVTSKIYDVTGAGDTVVATLTLALAAGAKVREAAELCNWTAGAVVRKVGTATATRKELEEIIRYRPGEKVNRKIRSLDELKKISTRLKKEGKKVVFTNGCFDLLHIGHIKYLQKAKEFGDVLVVGVNSDNSVKKVKGPKRPLLPQEERAKILAALEYVDYVTIFSALTPEKVIEALKPNVHVKGGDYQPEDLPEARMVESYGGKVMVVNEIEHRSTTELINLILNRFAKELR